MSEELANDCASPFAFAPGTIESPSLFRITAAGVPAPTAFEIKFLLDEALAREVEARLRGRLALDTHADPALGGAYLTTSLYTDTADFDVFHRLGQYGTSKFRVRRYGSGGPVFLERKDKTGDKVHKLRVPVPASDLVDLPARQLSAQWPGHWFRDEIGRRRLMPICCLSYERTAYLGSAGTGSVRVTFDRQVRGALTSSWEVIPARKTPALFTGRVICEFKYRIAVPQLFKEVMSSLGLQPTPCSKYREFIGHSGVVHSNGRNACGDTADV